VKKNEEFVTVARVIHSFIVISAEKAVKHEMTEQDGAIKEIYTYT